MKSKKTTTRETAPAKAPKTPHVIPARQWAAFIVSPSWADFAASLSKRPLSVASPTTTSIST